mmetsp:Transcript_6736/g.18037  ORF Transcript_6736/g.18037 Transcript_6736/m.18037 type:complete len:121 (+) Transcript_6736:129-491(+)|eukprot:CAMPEP_0202356968 /NCGR_PEP_ID=MMETSP1126-20121109/11196_1 /ASSEMBLY_ACC=CAM_ASM_000457 /TAXON_ID=3047 /ORGANISM="Dunaliella tertiolecta, Strain CCMP1320" /LENGTH=120 /DNA_ID=CAMNT_0048949781 /DNA_START=81 /DNA_END=443 /DNA_ORIENTATION=+
MSGVGTTSPDNHQRAKGPWVNACNGEIESVAPKYGCKPFACAIQDCLERHTYNQQVCGRAINNLIECCASLEKPHGSIHCEGFLGRVNRVREQRQQEKQQRQQQEEHQQQRRQQQEEQQH